MFYRIICRSGDRSMAYAEPVSNVRPVPVSVPVSVLLYGSDAVYYTDPGNRERIASAADIVQDPVVVSCFIENKCCRIALK